MTAVITTVIGPVGSEINVGVPPNRAAKRPTNTAPQRPAVAPAPLATPKARAIGKAITAAVTPPKRSPRRFLVLIRLSTPVNLLDAAGAGAILITRLARDPRTLPL